MNILEELFFKVKEDRRDTPKACEAYDKVYDIVEAAQSSLTSGQKDIAMGDLINAYEEQGFARGFAYAMSLQQALAKVEKECEPA